MKGARFASLWLLAAGLAVTAPWTARPNESLRPALADSADGGVHPVPAPAAAPPDGGWLVDEAGREYVLERTSKQGAVRIGRGKIRTRWGSAIDLVREDDHFYYYKLYRPSPAAEVPPPGPDPEAAAKVAETYRVEVPESDRLRLTSFDQGLPRTGQWRDGFAVADLNGDGHLDIVHGPPRKGPRVPVVFLGNGRGEWSPWRGLSFPPLPYDYGDVQVGDVNGDGRLDLVLAAHLRGLIALLAAERGRFVDGSQGLDLARNGPPGFSSRALRLVDWDGDGRLDIVALGEGPRRPLPGAPQSAGVARGVALYLNRRDGGWARHPQGAQPDAIFGGSLALGDFDGDGRIDFATASSVQGRRDLVNLASEGGAWRPTSVDAVRPNAYVRAVAAGDFDRDGRSDLVISYLSYEADTWRTGIDVLFPRGGGAWTRRAIAAEEGRRGVTALGAGDLDGDHQLDLVALTGDGEVLIFLGDGRGAFTRETTHPRFATCRGSHLELVDLDGDGRAEVVAAFADEDCPGEGGLLAWTVSDVRAAMAVPAPWSVDAPGSPPAAPVLTRKE